METPNLRLYLAAAELLGILHGPRRASPKRRVALQRHTDALAVIAMWPTQRTLRSVLREDLELARAQMLARGDEPALVERRVAAFEFMMDVAADRMWVGAEWARPLPSRPVSAESQEDFERRRDAIRRAMNQTPPES
jgi:hypothetical protein